MGRQTRIAIVGYGNIGRGVHKAIGRNLDMSLVGIISRDPERVEREINNVDVFNANNEDKWSGLLVDVAMLCGGSAKDLPVQGPCFAKFFNTVDSFDNHKHIGPYANEETGELMPGYYQDMDASARKGKHTSIISIGWDPGTFSMERILADSFFPGTKAYGFYGLSEKGGLSMGHSDAIRRVEGVKDARQYTHAIPEAMERVKSGENPDLKPGEMHWRECFVVAEEEYDIGKIEEEIKKMPNYFEPYRTEVYFVSDEEMKRDHSDMPHDGVVIAASETGDRNKILIEHQNTWDSNPEATASIMVAYARATYRLNQKGDYGAKTILDIAPALISPHSKEELIKV